jgi:hypothetical protein
MAKGFAIGQICSRLGRLTSSIPMPDASIPAPFSRWRTPRRRPARRRAGVGFGQLLAAIALLLRVALPGFEVPLLLSSESDAGGFSHKLCLAHKSETETPPQEAPNSGHLTHAACCSWHFSTGHSPVYSATLEPMAFAQLSIAFPPPARLFPRRPIGTVGARAPPLRA